MLSRNTGARRTAPAGRVVLAAFHPPVTEM
jgi:hypothetical protein